MYMGDQMDSNALANICLLVQKSYISVSVWFDD